MPHTALGEMFILIHYVSKFFDFFDTIFIVLRKKDDQVLFISFKCRINLKILPILNFFFFQLSFLHVFHHATIGPVWGYLLLLGRGSKN